MERVFDWGIGAPRDLPDDESYESVWTATPLFTVKVNKDESQENANVLIFKDKEYSEQDLENLKDVWFLWNIKYGKDELYYASSEEVLEAVFADSIATDTIEDALYEKTVEAVSCGILEDVKFLVTAELFSTGARDWVEPEGDGEYSSGTNYDFSIQYPAVKVLTEVVKETQNFEIKKKIAADRDLKASKYSWFPMHCL